MNNDGLVFETTRLIARQWSWDFAEEALEIYGDPDVTRYIGGVTLNSIDEMKVRIEEYLERIKNFPDGMGISPVFLKSTGSLIGTAILKPIPLTSGELSKDIEIGWHLNKRQWGRGYATEYGKKLIELGFETFNLGQVHAVVDLENDKSKKVAIRLGMDHIGQTSDYYEGNPIDHFVLTRQNYDKGLQ